MPELNLEQSGVHADTGSWSPSEAGGDNKGEDRGFLLRLYQDDDITTVTADGAKLALEAVRKRAEGWRNGVAASTALIFAVLSVKDEGIAKFGNESLVILAVAAAVTVVVALGSLYKMLRAANGPSWLDTRISDLSKPYDAKRYLVRAGGAAHDLKWGQRFWVGSVVGFMAVVLLTWTLPDDGYNWAWAPWEG